MGMIGEYARMTPAELDRAIRDPDWAEEFLGELIEADAEGDDARCLDIDKAWDVLNFLLRRADFPVDIVRGEQDIPGAGDFGHGPPRYLTQEQVRAAAAALDALPGELLVRGVTDAELTGADLYPNVDWAAGELLEYVAGHYKALVPYFQAAAAAGDAMIVWLS